MSLWSPIKEGLCTLRELQEYYTVDDLLEMIEFIYVKNLMEDRVNKKQAAQMKKR